MRRLAVVLWRLHPSDRAEAVVNGLLARDPELAAEVGAPQIEAPEGEGAES